MSAGWQTHDTQKISLTIDLSEEDTSPFFSDIIKFNVHALFCADGHR